MRQIKELIRALLKLLFHIDTENINSFAEDCFDTIEEKETFLHLLKMVDAGKISDAENKIYEMTTELNNKNLQISLCFYAYLNEKTDDFLEQSYFSREEIIQGLRNLLSDYGLNDMAEMFL